ncbi:MAG: aconitase X, partial [Pseudomonadota bacterium]
MDLNDNEKAMRDGAHGEALRWAIEQQIAVGGFFDAKDLVPITQVHMHADAEAVGVAGIEFLGNMLEGPAERRRFAVPVVSDPRGADFGRAADLNYDAELLAREARLRDVLAALGVLMTDTCVVYQCVLPPIRGEHIAFGDTGSVIYSNSVCGARSNYEGGPAALAAALTGRTPRYGFHLPERRRGTTRYRLAEPPRHLTDWGAIGALI